MVIPTPTTHVGLADHIEIEHERKLSGRIDFRVLVVMHEQMHNLFDHWDHTHSKTGDNA